MHDSHRPVVAVGGDDEAGRDSLRFPGGNAGFDVGTFASQIGRGHG